MCNVWRLACNLQNPILITNTQEKTQSFKKYLIFIPTNKILPSELIANKLYNFSGPYLPLPANLGVYHINLLRPTLWACQKYYPIGRIETSQGFSVKWVLIFMRTWGIRNPGSNCWEMVSRTDLSRSSSLKGFTRRKPSTK